MESRSTERKVDHLACQALLEVYQANWSGSKSLKVRTKKNPITFPFCVAVKRSRILIEFVPESLKVTKEIREERKAALFEAKKEGFNRILRIPASPTSKTKASREAQLKHIFSHLKPLLGASRLSSKKLEECDKIFRKLSKQSSKPKAKKTEWPKEALNYLQKNYSERSTYEIAAWLKLPLAVVESKAKTLRLKKATKAKKRGKQEQAERKRYTFYTKNIVALKLLTSDDWLTTDSFVRTLGITKGTLFAWEKKRSLRGRLLLLARGYVEPYPGYRIVAYTPEQAATILTQYHINIRAQKDGKTLEQLSRILRIPENTLRKSTSTLRQLGLFVGNGFGNEPHDVVEYYRVPTRKELEKLLGADRSNLNSNQMTAKEASKVLKRTEQFVAQELRADGYYVDKKSGKKKPYFNKKRIQRLKRVL